MMKMSCNSCGAYGHTSINCFRKRRKIFSSKKHIHKVGKVGRQWISTRNEWVKKNIPDNGIWNCYYCGRELHLNTLTLDHKLARSRRPDLRFDLDNLVAACADCNVAKGSRSDKEYLSLLNSID